MSGNMNDSIIRRDPRKEWILRNRLHPQHADIASQSFSSRASASALTEWIGPQGIKRKAPHNVGFIGPNGIRRIDRSGAQQGGVASRKEVAQQSSRRLHSIDQPQHHIMVVADMTGGRLSAQDKDILGLAHQLAAKKAATAVMLVVFGEHKETTFAESGVDRLLHIEGDAFEGFSPDLRLAWLAAIEREMQPDYWIFPDSGLGGGDLGRRLAVELEVHAATGLWQVNLSEDDFSCTCRASAATQDLTRALPRVILALAECAEPISDTLHEAQEVKLMREPLDQLPRIQDLGAVAVDPASVSLAEAEFILSGGNGIRDWDAFHETARILGATEGASRVAVDDGFMPRDRQVGATGTWVTARVYMAVGISGAIQHLQGIQSCDKVICINTDAGCDMVKRADLALIGDSTEILAAVRRKVSELKQEKRHVA